MEEFFPSEIARLVLGYLEEMNCPRSWKTFIRESSSLSEYFNLYQKGKVYSTNVNGKSLLDILKEYCYLKREAMLKKQEDFLKKGGSAETLKDCITRNKDSAEKIVKDAVDHAFHQYFPSICKSKSDVCSDSVAMHTNETEKGGIMSENVKDLSGCKNSINETGVKYDKNTSCASPQISISEVTSLGDFNPFKEVICLDSKKDYFDSSENESVHALDVVKLESDNDIVVTDIVSSTQDKSIDTSNDANQCREHESMDSCNIDDEHDAQNKIISMSRKSSHFPDLALANFPESCDFPTKPADVTELEYLDNLENPSDHNIESNKIVHESLFQSQSNATVSSASLCGSNNLDAKQNLSLNTENLVQGDDVVNTLNSSNNQPTFILTTNSLPNQCGTVPLSTVPTYILPSSCFLQNNAPYQFLINSTNGLPLAVPNIPANLAKPTLTGSDSTDSVIKLKTYSRQEPFISQDSANKVSSTAAVVTNNEVLETVTVDEKESAKQKKTDKSSVKKRTNSSEVPSKTPAKKKPADKEIESDGPKPKRKYKRCPRKKLIPLFQSPPKASTNAPAKKKTVVKSSASVVIKKLSFAVDEESL